MALDVSRTKHELRGKELAVTIAEPKGMAPGSAGHMFNDMSRYNSGGMDMMGGMGAYGDMFDEPRSVVDDRRIDDWDSYVRGWTDAMKTLPRLGIDPQ